MSLRVGRCKYSGDGAISYPNVPGFTNIPVITKSRGKYSQLSPFYLVDEQGRIMENLWQFSKIYEVVPKSRQVKSRWDPQVIWEYPKEQHITYINGLPYPNTNYLRWREMGMRCPHAIRYSVGYKNKGKVICSYRNLPDGSIDFANPMDYITARKAIYFPLYTSMVQMGEKMKLFNELRGRLATGENLCIIDVDGPHQESMPYYLEKYQGYIDETFIQYDSILINETHMRVLLNDPLHPFGHGYCLAMALLNMGI